MIEVDAERDLDADVTVVTLAGTLRSAEAEPVLSLVETCRSECPSALIVDLLRATLAEPPVWNAILAAARANGHLPGVAVLACAGGAVWPSLGGVPAFETLDAARTAAQQARADARRTEVPIPPVPASVAIARDAAARACADWRVPAVEEPLKLVVSELVTNAIVHSGGSARLELALRDDFVHVCVRDASPLPPALVQSGNAAAGGRGLMLVDLYSAGWGYRLGPGGKVVWAAVRHRGVEQPHPG